MSRFSPWAAALLCLACTAGCSLLSVQPQRGTLAAKMMNLSAAVDIYFSELPVPPVEIENIEDMRDNDLLKRATAHDEDLLADEFDQYQLKVEYQNTHAVLLLCTKDGKALMEDVGCSARLDRKAFRENLPCTFTLKVTEGCEVTGADPE